MDLQTSLVSLSSFLIKDKEIAGNLTLSVYNQNGFYSIVIRSEYGEHAPTATGTNENLLTAYLKSILEFGEEILRGELGLNDRCGMAGGLIRKNIIERAKAELLERDSFLYHYRSKHPLKKLRTITYRGKVFDVFQMHCCQKGYYAIFIKEPQKYYLEREICHFTTASGRNLEATIKKALEEYFSLEIFLDKNRSDIVLLLDGGLTGDNPIFPHVKSMFDERNLNRINHICNESLPKEHSGPQTEREIPSWEVEKLGSPLKLFDFYKLKSSNLHQLDFGTPEEKISPPLYHPFW
ncbi:MAG: hypothetical protein ISR65_03835 [Bacteriovoracaceae bacterium]|nr:hypothetical protein [Bacteriovoracaceae bacterium]